MGQLIRERERETRRQDLETKLPQKTVRSVEFPAPLINRSIETPRRNQGRDGMIGQK
jgi:hypothetical protein